MEGECYCCEKVGHESPQFRHKNRPKEVWAINKAKSKELSVSQIWKTTTTTSTPTAATSSKKYNNEIQGKRISWMDECTF